MDSFEFAQIPIAIIIGFGITEILASWGYQLRNRGRVAWSRLHFLASAWILLMGVRYIWIQWGWREIEWTFGDYFLALVPALLIALAAHVAKVDAATPSSGSIYEDCRRPMCWLLAFVVILTMARVALTPAPTLARGGFLPLAALLALPPTFAWLALSRTTAHHGVGWIIAWAILLIMSTQTIWSIGAV